MEGRGYMQRWFVEPLLLCNPLVCCSRSDNCGFAFLQVIMLKESHYRVVDYKSLARS